MCAISGNHTKSTNTVCDQNAQFITLKQVAASYIRTLTSKMVTLITTRFLIVEKAHVLPHTVYLCVLCGSEKEQRLFPYTTLTDWFL